MILFVGDPHGHFEPILARAERDQTPDRTLAEILGKWAERTWYILGNHDSDQEGYLLSHWGRMEDRNLHGRAQTVAGMCLAGLGGVFRSQVWYPPDPPKWRKRADFTYYTKPAHRFMGGPPVRDWTSIFPEDVATLSCLQEDILVTTRRPPHTAMDLQSSTTWLKPWAWI